MDDSEYKIIKVYGDKLAKAHPGQLPAYERLISTRSVTFACAWCGKQVTQQRYPSRGVKYCSSECQQKGQRSKTRARVRRLRERQQNELEGVEKERK